MQPRLQHQQVRPQIALRPGTTAAHPANLSQTALQVHVPPAAQPALERLRKIARRPTAKGTGLSRARTWRSRRRPSSVRARGNSPCRQQGGRRGLQRRGRQQGKAGSRPRGAPSSWRPGGCRLGGRLRSPCSWPSCRWRKLRHPVHCPKHHSGFTFVHVRRAGDDPRKLQELEVAGRTVSSAWGKAVFPLPQ